jgi:anti-anti-sigma regulatory factor
MFVMSALSCPGEWGARSKEHTSAASRFVKPRTDRFSHEHAAAISEWALSGTSSQTVVVDLSDSRDATTAAFATLVVLRRKLLREGRDLRLAGLRERTQHVYSIARLGGVLPAD